MTPPFDVLVLGAGIVGAACARECAQAGLRVGIVEPSVPGGSATAAAMGHIVAMDDSPAQLALSRFSQQLWQELAPFLPAAVEYEERGTLWVAADDEEMAEVHRKAKTYAAAGIPAHILDAATLAKAEPNLRPGLAGALLVPGDSVIYPPAAARFFLDEAVHAGAQLLRAKEAASISGGAVTLENGTRLSAEHILVATGTDTRLLPQLTIQKRKGHLVITDRYPGFVHHQLVELGYLKSAGTLTTDSVAFNLQPRRTGQLLIGSSRQYGMEDPAADHATVRRMLDRACCYMPALKTLSALRIWTGFRAATPDKLPLIGPMEDSRILLAMGFEGLGITNAPGAARLVLDYILHRPSAIAAKPYLPNRAAIPELAHA